MPDLYALVAELTCGEEARAEKAAEEIASLQADAIPVLQSLLNSQDEDTRWWATRTLGAIKNPNVTPLLLRALRDQEESVRYCAAVALREQPDATAIPALITQLGSSDPIFTRLAADALAAIGTPATPALIAVFENGTNTEVISAVRALSQIGDYRAIPALFKALDHDSIVTQHLADKGLDHLGVGMNFFDPE
ncbi:MAG: HEAT repeat domain-containing protein [Anaerolineales bacterium]